MKHEDVPEYVDSSTPSWQWYGYNSLILLATLGMMYLSLLLLEYEIARLLHPNVGFIATPMLFDISISTVVLVLGLTNLAVLSFVFMRHLWRRHWMIATTILGWVLLAVVALVLGQRFIPVFFP